MEVVTRKEKQGKGGIEKEGGMGVEKIIESCFVFAGVGLTASSTHHRLTLLSCSRSYSRYCVESAYGGGRRLWRCSSRRPPSQDHRSSLSHSLVHSLAEIFQKSKTCDKSGRERHTPFIQTVLVRHTMSLSIQNRAFVLRSSTKSARFCQLLWLLKCEGKKNKKSL